MAVNEGTRADGLFICISLTPDVCKSPVVPVPYPIVGFFTASTMLSPNVRFRGWPVFTKASRLTTVVGDEAGTGGGVVSGVNKGWCRPTSFNPTVSVNGQKVAFHAESMMDMNCAGPGGVKNTVGFVKFLGPMFAVAVSPSGEIPPGDPPVGAESAAESSFLGDLMNQVGGIDGLMKLGQQAYSLATTDWSNPGAVLGAIGGVAGLAGLGQVAQVAGYAQQAYGLATTDFSNPGAVMSSVMGIAGPAIAGSMKGGGNKPTVPPGVILN